MGAACMTDHGPIDCGEPMWIYGAPDYVNGQVPSYGSIAMDPDGRTLYGGTYVPDAAEGTIYRISW